MASDTEIRLLEQRVASIETNMSTKSDIGVLNGKIDSQAEGFKAIKELAEKIDRLVTQNAKREENDRHIEKGMERINMRIEALEKSDHETRVYIAADKPYKDMRSVAMKAVIGFIVAGILAAAFTLSR